MSKGIQGPKTDDSIGSQPTESEVEYHAAIRLERREALEERELRAPVFSEWYDDEDD